MLFVLRRLVSKSLKKLGLELRRSADSDIPFIQSIDCGGETFLFWIANQSTKQWWGRKDVSYTSELSTLRSFCTPGSVVFDVGAHHGFLTILFSRWVGPTGRVHAFEPSAPNVLALDANIALNRLQNCTRQFAAIGSTAGTTEMNGESVANHSGAGRAVPRVALDDYCRTGNISKVDVIKIDVEGFEGQVLRGAQRLLAGRPKIALELHLDDLATFNDSAEAVLGLLPREGYSANIMMRPDWNTLKPWHGPQDLPSHGVVNIFLSPVA
jgi:FkbM family methyltransferase